MRTAKSLSTAKQLRSGDDCAVFPRATHTLTAAATSVFKLNYSSTAIPSWLRVMTSSIEIAGLHPGVTDMSLLRSWKYGGLICPGVAPHATDMSSLRDLKKNSEYSKHPQHAVGACESRDCRRAVRRPAVALFQARLPQSGTLLLAAPEIRKSGRNRLPLRTRQYHLSRRGEIRKRQFHQVDSRLYHQKTG